MRTGLSRLLMPGYLFSRPLYLVTGCWFIMQVLLYMRFGIYTEGESWKYIYEAEWLIKYGEFTSNNYYFYLVNILVIALSLKLKTGFVLPVIIQLILNLGATLVFYKWTSTLFSNRTGLIATLMLILFLPFQQFNFFLQTESVYYSLIIIYSYIVYNSWRLTPIRIAAILLLLLILVFTRPTGILIIIPTWAFLYHRFLSKQSIAKRLIFISIPFALFIPGLHSIMRSGGELNFMLPLIEQHIICGVRTTAPTIVENNPELNSLAGILGYISEEPMIFSKLAMNRTLAFFGLYRDYFSALHNLENMLVFFVLYILILQSIRRWSVKYPELLTYLLVAILITWLTAVLTCDDWHNRFLFSMYPFLLILALPAVEKLTIRLSGPRKIN